MGLQLLFTEKKQLADKGAFISNYFGIVIGMVLENIAENPFRISSENIQMLWIKTLQNAPNVGGISAHLIEELFRKMHYNLRVLLLLNMLNDTDLEKMHDIKVHTETISFLHKATKALLVSFTIHFWRGELAYQGSMRVKFYADCRCSLDRVLNPTPTRSVTHVNAYNPDAQSQQNSTNISLIAGQPYGEIYCRCPAEVQIVWEDIVKDPHKMEPIIEMMLRPIKDKFIREVTQGFYDHEIQTLCASKQPKPKDIEIQFQKIAEAILHNCRMACR